MRTIQVEPLTHEAFAPFGQFSKMESPEGYALCGDDPAAPGMRFGHGGAAGSQGFADRERQMALGFTKNMPLASHPDHPIRTKISEILGIRKIIW